MNPLVGVLIVTYLFGVIASVYVSLEVGNPMRRALYLVALTVAMIVGSVMARLYLISERGFALEFNWVNGNLVVGVRRIYTDEPYAPAVSTLLASMALVPAVLSIPVAVELLSGRRWFR